MLALIDYDVVAYMASAAVQSKYYNVADEEGAVVASFKLKKDLYSYLEEFDGSKLSVYISYSIPPAKAATDCADIMIKTIVNNTKADKYRGFLTGENNFRNKVAITKPYKGNRDGSSKPVHLDAVRDHILINHSCIMAMDMEADDELGIEQTSTLGESIICTIDKDLDMISGLHYNISKETVYSVEYIDGIRFFYTQILTGDAVDNIPGLYHHSGGVAKASKSMKDFIQELTIEEEMFKWVLKCYTDAIPDTLEAMKRLDETASLVWIRRHKRYSYRLSFMDYICEELLNEKSKEEV